MKDFKGIILVVCYVASMALAFSTVYDVDAVSGSLTLRIAVAMLLALAGMAISLVEVIKSARLSNLEKVMWVVMILFVYTIGGLLYIIFRRRRVIQE